MNCDVNNHINVRKMPHGGSTYIVSILICIPASYTHPEEGGNQLKSQQDI